MLGKRVRIYWDGEKKFFYAHVLRRSKARRQLYVVYELDKFRCWEDERDCQPLEGDPVQVDATLVDATDKSEDRSLKAWVYRCTKRACYNMLHSSDDLPSFGVKTLVSIQLKAKSTTWLRAGQPIRVNKPGNERRKGRVKRLGVNQTQVLVKYDDGICKWESSQYCHPGSPSKK